MPAIHDAARFPFVVELERAFPAVLAELRGLGTGAFVPSPDSLTMVADGYDERGWRWFALFGGAGDDAAVAAANRARCPRTAAACESAPGLVNAGFSLLQPGTHLYPHCGEMQGVLRCHLPLVVPAGDVALRFADTVHRWQPGRCVVFDDTFEHEAWNRGDGDRIVLLITFAAALP
jgi:ornithine lipid ester-linked acyl 2-hydroxylase